MSVPDSLCAVLFRPDLGLLVARWAADAPVPELQLHFQEILRTAQAHAAARWLLDVRRRDQLEPEFGHWTNYEFLPRAASCFAPQALRVAVLCSPARLAVYESTPEQSAYLHFGLSAERPYQLRLFIEEGPALAWLRGE